MAKTAQSRVGMRLLPRRWQMLLRDDGGTTLVEFGLLALPFFAIMGAIMETSVVFIAGQVLDSAVLDSSRLIRTGQSQTTITSVADFKADLCDRLYGLFSDCSGLHVEVETITNFDAAEISAPIEADCELPCDWSRDEVYSAGSGSSIVMVQVYYKWPVMLSLGDFSLANIAGNKRVLGAAALFRNEPF